MNRPSPSTVPSPTRGPPTLPSAAVSWRADSGRDSGSFTNTTTAQASVITASTRKPAR